MLKLIDDMIGVLRSLSTGPCKYTWTGRHHLWTCLNEQEQCREEPLKPSASVRERVLREGGMCERCRSIAILQVLDQDVTTIPTEAIETDHRHHLEHKS